MPIPSSEPSINWVQILDLVGDEHDKDQMAVLGSMWGEMIVDVRAQWTSLAEITEEAELRRATHRLRGLVAMWGLVEVAGWLLACEKSASPLAAWREGSVAIAAACNRDIAEIERRFPGLIASK